MPPAGMIHQPGGILLPQHLCSQQAVKLPPSLLNDKPIFMSGVLDQGYWSDGLYTAPADEAMVYDIQKMKECGFNMLRKHIAPIPR